MHGNTALYMATSSRCVDGIRLLLDHGADMLRPRYPTRTGLSAFELAMELGNAEVVRVFIEAGGDVNAPMKRWDGAYQKALHIATRFGYPSIVELLLAHGADPFSYTEHEGARETALHIASRYGRLKICQYLVNAIKASSHPPPSIFLPDDRGNCPLTFAEGEDVIEFLTEAGKSQPCRNCAMKPAIQPEGETASRPSNCSFDSTDRPNN